jgi:hypothetical protein
LPHFLLLPFFKPWEKTVIVTITRDKASLTSEC